LTYFPYTNIVPYLPRVYKPSHLANRLLYTPRRRTYSVHKSRQYQLRVGVQGLFCKL